jgi:ribosomal protein S18 acetylase RimI-like enzyme
MAPGDSFDRRAELAHANLMEVNELLTRAETGAVDRRGGELLFAGTQAFPMLNGAMREGGGDATAFVARACAFFAERGRGWMAYVHPADGELEEAVRAAGLSRLMDYPEMACSRRLPESDLPAGVELRAVDDLASARQYWTVCERSYGALGFPPGVFDSFSTDLLLRDEVDAWIASVDGRPAATAMIALSGPVGMVCWVATLDEMRRRGLAAICTVRATNAAFERGAELASLQASPMGQSLYERLGYEELFRYRLYLKGRFSG